MWGTRYRLRRGKIARTQARHTLGVGPTAGVTTGSFLFKSGSTWGGIVKPPTRLLPTPPPLRTRTPQARMLPSHSPSRVGANPLKSQPGSRKRPEAGTMGEGDRLHGGGTQPPPQART